MDRSDLHGARSADAGSQALGFHCEECLTEAGIEFLPQIPHATDVAVLCAHCGQETQVSYGAYSLMHELQTARLALRLQETQRELRSRSGVVGELRMADGESPSLKTVRS